MANFLTDLISRVQNLLSQNNSNELIHPVPNTEGQYIQRKREQFGDKFTPEMEQNFRDIYRSANMTPQPGITIRTNQPSRLSTRLVSPETAVAATPSPAVLAASTQDWGIPADLASPALPVHEGWKYPTVSPDPNAQLDPQFVSVLENKIFPVTDAAGIPRALVAGQVAIETGYGTSDLAKNKNNYFGLLNSRKGQFYSFDDPAKGAETYAYTMTKGNFKDRYNADPVKYLYNLQNAEKPRYEGHSDKPYEYVSLVASSPAFRKYYSPPKGSE